MRFDAQQHNRRSLRVPGFGYSAPGAYFVTICTYGRGALFGEVAGEEMVLGEFGEIAREQWFQTAILRSYVRMAKEDFVVMPNHIHGVIEIVENDTVWARYHRAHTVERFGRPGSGSLPTIVRAYKSAVTYQINGLRDTRKAPVWQRNY